MPFAFSFLLFFSRLLTRDTFLLDVANPARHMAWPACPRRRRHTHGRGRVCPTDKLVHGFFSSSARHTLHLALAPWRPRARWPRPGGRMPQPSKRTMEAASPCGHIPSSHAPSRARPMGSHSRQAAPPMVLKPPR